MERSDPRKRLVLPTRPLVTLLKPRVSAAIATAREFYKFPFSTSAVKAEWPPNTTKKLSSHAPQMVRFIPSASAKKYLRSQALYTEAEGDI